MSAGSEPWYVVSPADSRSLTLPQGAHATSPTYCVGVDQPNVRFFAKGTGTLAVDVSYKGPLGISTVQIDARHLPDAWQPSTRVPITVNLLRCCPATRPPSA
ncbi:hypothetical protein E6W39_03600 [Kitasatospora acidiphila]|uniref:Uncharacterized protein n=1 Tax=Kitasatospora acidiphila TaxID=2567942 RepID=A0A540VXK0_9ACTN|nr:hypothetical protein [Kitasatospora acidiphila]TQF01496.1 hypothetical protein E6W39_03600 [Kitasatospora acidiphila]